ncbi:MAG TPA: hypothetical protein VJ771_07945 [Candidatus Nitrosotalea sp.]|nr:hypothetical protein [Candidatus Nitrosotalea sp.]
MKIQCPDCKKPLLEFDHGSGNYHCSNPSCSFQYLEMVTGKEHRKSVKVEEIEPRPLISNLDKKPKRILVGLAIESALLSMGPTIFDKVITKLQDDYNANVFDCLENPRYLKKVLERNLDKNVQSAMVKSIKTMLGEFAYYESVREFLDEVSGKT